MNTIPAAPPDHDPRRRLGYRRQDLPFVDLAMAW